MKVSELIADNYTRSMIVPYHRAFAWNLILAIQKIYGYQQGVWETRISNLKELLSKVLPTWDWSGRELSSPDACPTKLNMYEKGNFEYIIRNLSHEEAVWLARELDI